MTEAELIEREERTLGGRDGVEPIDYALLDGGVAVLVYRTRSAPIREGGSSEARVLVSVRYAVYVPDGGGSGGIVSSTWETVPADA